MRVCAPFASVLVLSAAITTPPPVRAQAVVPVFPAQAERADAVPAEPGAAPPEAGWAPPTPEGWLPWPLAWSGERGGRAAEGEDEIETERDAFTPRTRTVARGRTIVETSYSFLDAKDTTDRHSYPELLARYGLTDRIELRVGWNREWGGRELLAGGPGLGEDVGEVVSSGAFEGSGGQTLLYGLKFYTTRQQEWVPESSIIFQGYTPTGGAANDSKFLTRYVFGWYLPNRWKLDSSISFLLDSEGQDHFTTWTPSVVLRVPVVRRAWVHFEYFGLFRTQREENTDAQFFSSGFSYDITPNFEIGWRGGVGLTETSPNYFSNVGAGFRF